MLNQLDILIKRTHGEGLVGNSGDNFGRENDVTFLLNLMS